MAETENPSNFNGLIIEISGKALIQNLYLEHTNQHQIVIGLPQLDNADRHMTLSQNGNASNLIDLSKYSSIDIVEISQQPPTARQANDINIEAALSRNQERLSDFYQSYKNEDSSIDLSKIATKITLSNTSGTFYDHEDKYTTGLKIEFSAQGIESIEFRDGTTGEAIATLSALQLPATMVIGNLCNIDSKIDVGDSPQGTFCSPFFSALSHLQVAAAPIWSQCSQCAVLYDVTQLNSCFGSSSVNQSSIPIYGGHAPYGDPVYLPYDQNPNQYTLATNPGAVENIGGCGLACEKCGMLVYNNSRTPSTTAPNYCPSNNGSHTWANYTNAYWVQTEPINGKTSSNWFTCSACSGLFNSSSTNQACFGSNLSLPTPKIVKHKSTGGTGDSVTTS